MIVPVDAWGERLEQGDIVVYPVRSGSHVRMVRARIATVADDGTVRVLRLQEASLYRYDNVEPKVVPLGSTGHCTKVTSC